MQPQPRRQAGTDCLRNNFAAIVLGKAVDGHPVEARDGAYLFYGMLAKVQHFARRQHLAQRRVQKR